MPASSRLWRLARPALLSLALLAVGCGDDDTPEAGESRSAPVAETPTPQPTEDTGAPSWGMNKPGAATDVGSAEAPGDEAAPEADDAPVIAPPPSAPEASAPAGDEIVDRDDHVDFALDFLGRQGYNSVPGFMELYGSQVRYYDRGTVSQDAVAEDKAAYFERWPNRYFELAGPVRATRGATPTLRFDYSYAVSHADLSGEREGRAWVELGLSPLDDGTSYVITSERGGTY